MKSLLVASGLALIAFTGAVHAAPAFCTGTTTVITSGTFVPGTSLVGTGNCIEASDKIFGAFTVGGAITGAGSAGWLFTMPTGPADVTIAFDGAVGPSTSGSVNYDVAVDPAKSNGALISALEKDFTINCQGVGCTATLFGTVSPGASSFTGGDITTGFQCTRTGTTATCPQTGFFNPLTAMLTVDEKITTGPNTTVTQLQDTVFQQVNEPGTLAILGSALIGLWFMARRRRMGSRFFSFDAIHG